MLVKLIENNNYRRCVKNTLPLVKKNNIIEDTTNISLNRGDIPINCSHNDFNKILKILEVKTENIFVTDAKNTSIYKIITDFDENKLEKLKKL